MGGKTTMNPYILCLILCLVSLVTTKAQNVKKVHASYTYYAPETMSVEEAKRTALERAKIQAIADEFGTLVTQSSSTVISNKNGESDTQFFSIGGSDVKGEWIETIGKPVYDIKFEDKFFIITCTVKGTAREIESEKIEFIAKPLRNGTTLKYESTEFKDGDDLYLYFKSPESGFISVFLSDHVKHETYCLYPYKHDETSSPCYIEADIEYVLFSKRTANIAIRDLTDEYTLSCHDNIEFNTIYVVYSPNNFSKGYMDGNESLYPKYCAEEEFIRWLTKLKKHNKKVGIQEYLITITK